MLKYLARLFSLLSLLAITAMAGLVLYNRHAPPVAPVVRLTDPIDRIVVEKSARRMTLYRGQDAVRIYDVALGFTPEGDKTRQGDGKTPEGRFAVNRRNGASRYHLSLGITYPEAADIARARAGGFDPGGDIFFHGQPNGFPASMTLRRDWTAGCIALSNAEIEELWRVTPIGTPVEIRP
jgi:murein L,D-transpeptidase YafK